MFHEIIYKVNKVNGLGKEYSNTDLKFEGEYFGKGKEYYENFESDKLKFDGIYLNDKKWEGKGYDLSNNIIYELKNGKGYIKEYNFNNNKIEFEGEYLNGEKNGKAKEYYYKTGQLKFEGEYLNNKRHKYGK
jgi:hypothetical protein